MTTDITPEAAERARFEAWAGREGHMLRRNSVNANLYSDCFTQEAWRAWNAALAAQEGGGERVTDDPVIPDMPAYLAEGGDVMVGWDSGYMNGWCDCLKALRAAQEGTGNGSE